VSKLERTARLLEVGSLWPLLKRTWRGVLVLNYHRIGDGSYSPFDRSLWSCTREDLDGQLAFLRKHFEVIAPPDLAGVLSRNRGRYVLLTFDDGYRDNYVSAYPVLRAHGVTATFFLATGFLDAPRIAPWDEIAWMVNRTTRAGLPAGGWLDAPVSFDEAGRERTITKLRSVHRSLTGHRAEPFLEFVGQATGAGRCPRERARDMWMTWDMVREMRRGGMHLGGHTVNHPVLARLTYGQQEAEISGCLRRIEAETGERMRWFSFPVGLRDAFNSDTHRCLHAHGIEMAFSFYGGYCGFRGCDPYDVPRASVGPAVSQSRFRALATLPRMYARW
jgi:peptidoglycan/xylan/chitin deacetylase (PgdA/CDA1 family)